MRTFSTPRHRDRTARTGSLRRLVQSVREVLTAPLPPSVGERTLPASRIDEVTDPDGNVRLFRIVGPTSAETVAELDALTATAAPHSVVHLDLADARISTVEVMRGLERVVDRLEAGLVHLRVVGVDPNHPTLQH